MYRFDLCTLPVNLAGIGSMSVPSGLSVDDGMPVGLQIMAPALADDRLYRVGAAYEAATENELNQVYEGIRDTLGDRLGHRRIVVIGLIGFGVAGSAFHAPLIAAERGARQVFFAVVATTVVLLSVFAPLLFLPGYVGRLFVELAAAIAAAAAVSARRIRGPSPIPTAWGSARIAAPGATPPLASLRAG